MIFILIFDSYLFFQVGRHKWQACAERKICKFDDVLKRLQ